MHKFHDGPTYGYSYTWKLFESLVKQRPIPILYETPGKELIQHDITKEILGVRAAARREIDLRQGAPGRGADLRRLREQPGDDPQLPARHSVLLHLGLALQRRRRHHDGDVGGRRPVAHEQLCRAVDGAEGAGDTHVVFDAGAALQQGEARRHDRRRPRCAGVLPTRSTRPGTARSR